MTDMKICPECNTRPSRPKSPLCLNCYKKLWSRKNGKTIHHTKYKEAYAQYIGPIKDLAGKGYNYSEIGRELGLNYDIIRAVSENSKIEIKKLCSHKTLEKLKELEGYLSNGENIYTAAKKAKIAPKIAYPHAKKLGYKSVEVSTSRLSPEQLSERLNETLKIINTISVEGRLRYVVQCEKCGRVSNKDPSYLHKGCRYCTGTGETEQAILEWIKSLGLKAQKITFNGKDKTHEIDIYIPKLHIGIEYCGLRWHSRLTKDRSYHYRKYKDALNRGVRLITIFEDEWLERSAQCRDFIRSALGLYTQKVYARKCTVAEVGENIAKEFLDKHHIQGNRTSAIRIGLFHKEELVGVVTSGEHHRGGCEVLSRLCFKSGVQVVGGTAKLVSHLAAKLKKNGHTTLITWSDNRWSQGGAYSKIFEFDGDIKVDYSYVKNKKRFSKNSMRKKKLIEMGGVGQTENELAKSLDYDRIFDCGKKRWRLDLK